MSLYLINITKILLFYHLNRIRMKLILKLFVTQNNKILKRLLFHFRIMKDIFLIEYISFYCRTSFKADYPISIGLDYLVKEPKINGHGKISHCLF